MKDAYHFQAYSGLETVAGVNQQYLFIPAKVKEVYLYHLLQALEDHKVRSAIIFMSTCKVRRFHGGRVNDSACHSAKPTQRGRMKMMVLPCSSAVAAVGSVRVMMENQLLGNARFT